MIVVIGVDVNGSIFVLILSVFSLFFCQFVLMTTVVREFCFVADPPEGVQLQVSGHTVCKGANVIFNCSAADANPMELTYHLYENNVMVINSSSSTGIWNRAMTTRGVFGYSCEVTNIVGTTMGPDVSITVNGKHGTFLTNKRIRKHVFFLEKQSCCIVFLDNRT